MVMTATREGTKLFLNHLLERGEVRKKTVLDPQAALTKTTSWVA